MVFVAALEAFGLWRLVTQYIDPRTEGPAEFVQRAPPDETLRAQSLLDRMMTMILLAAVVSFLATFVR